MLPRDNSSPFDNDRVQRVGEGAEPLGSVSCTDKVEGTMVSRWCSLESLGFRAFPLSARRASSGQSIPRWLTREPQ